MDIYESLNSILVTLFNDATPYQDSTLAKIHEIFLESREYKGRSDKARELYDGLFRYEL